MKNIHWRRHFNSALQMVCIMFLVFSLGASASAHIVSFSPEGTVKDLRQVSVIFSEPMIAIGSVADKLPFDIYCQATGKGRWIDSTTWVYDFGTNLPGGCKCEFVLKKGLKSLSGREVTGKVRYSFSTGGL